MSIMLLESAVVNYDLDTVRSILESGTVTANELNEHRVYNSSQTLLTMSLSSVHRNSEEIAELLINYGADINIPNEHGDYALYYAISIQQSIELCRFLVNKGADVSIAGNNFLHSAVIFNNIDICHLLIDKGAYVNAMRKDGCTPLHFSKSVDIAKLLIDKGAYVNAMRKDGCTPLHFAVAHKHSSIAKILIAKGSDVNVKGKDGKTPLHFSSNIEVSQMLIDRGADLNAQDDNNKSVLWHSLRYSIDCTIMLIDNGADINAKGSNGNTLLHMGLGEDIVRLLVAAGADLNILNDNGESAFNFVVSRGLSNVVNEAMTNLTRYNELIQQNTQDVQITFEERWGIYQNHFSDLRKVIPSFEEVKTFFDVPTEQGKRYFVLRLTHKMIESLPEKILLKELDIHYGHGVALYNDLKAGLFNLTSLPILLSNNENGDQNKHFYTKKLYASSDIRTFLMEFVGPKGIKAIIDDIYHQITNSNYPENDIYNNIYGAEESKSEMRPSGNISDDFESLG